MKVAIRDDDTSFFTKVNELERAFEGLDDFPISLSVVPFAIAEHRGSFPYGEVNIDERYSDINLNTELVEYLREGIKKRQFEIIQHGIHHEYKKNINEEWLAETEFMEEAEMKEGIRKGRSHLEKVFRKEIDIFAAPSNAVSVVCSSVLDQLGMNVNCVVGRCMKRKLEIRYIYNYIKINLFKLMTGCRYAGRLKYSNHIEMNINEFSSYETAWLYYQQCKKNDFPMIVFTHYWDLNSNAKRKEELVRFVQDAIADGAEPSFVSECFKS